jgi:hypothetical protein
LHPGCLDSAGRGQRSRPFFAAQHINVLATQTALTDIIFALWRRNLPKKTGDAPHIESAVSIGYFDRRFATNDLLLPESMIRVYARAV